MTKRNYLIKKTRSGRRKGISLVRKESKLVTSILKSDSDSALAVIKVAKLPEGEALIPLVESTLYNVSYYLKANTLVISKGERKETTAVY